MRKWHAKAIEISALGYSDREVARRLSIGKTTVNDFLRKYRESTASTSAPSGPKLLFLDIETAPITLSGWGLFNQNFSTSQISTDWYIISFCAKWGDSDEEVYMDITEHLEEELLLELRDLLTEADFVIGHNMRRFDLKKIKTRMIMSDIGAFPQPRVIDTLEIARREFGFTSNRLEYLTHVLCKQYKKSSHGQFAGFSLWKEFLLGNPEAIKEMREYNILDVKSLEELFYIMLPWTTNLPNFDLYKEDIDLDNYEEVGHHYTNLGKYKKYKCLSTGRFVRGRKNILEKDFRSKLFANAV